MTITEIHPKLTAEEYEQRKQMAREQLKAEVKKWLQSTRGNQSTKKTV